MKTSSEAHQLKFGGHSGGGWGGFDPLMFPCVMRSFNITSLSGTTYSTTTSRCPHGFRLGPHVK